MADICRKWIIGAAALLLAACNPIAVLDETGTEIEQFHADMQAGDMDALWDITHQQFRDATPRKQYEHIFALLGGALGEHESSERDTFNINTNNGVTTADVVMTSRFTNGEATETFHWIQEGTDWKLLGYFVESPLLLNYTLPPEASDQSPVAAGKLAAAEGK